MLARIVCTAAALQQRNQEMRTPEKRIMRMPARRMETPIPQIEIQLAELVIGRRGIRMWTNSRSGRNCIQQSTQTYAIAEAT
jgi:hypothetical protein